uniref:Uncharacterized protein n=1 Tax=Rhizophagus irregularis (strain DAOM 181602 / DAOM 197198 / MUCL 43194) TaxID=747089 RepID=U9T4J8_RHIID
MAMKFQVGNWLAFGRFEATEEGMRFKSELVTIHMMHCILGFQNQYYAVP